MVRNRVGVVCVAWCSCMDVMCLSVYRFVEEGAFTCCSTCIWRSGPGIFFNDSPDQFLKLGFFLILELTDFARLVNQIISSAEIIGVCYPSSPIYLFIIYNEGTGDEIQTLVLAQQALWQLSNHRFLLSVNLCIRCPD